MELKLSEDEQDLLTEILEERHRELLLEISRTDHHDFKIILQRRIQHVESMLENLGVTVLIAK